MIDSRTPLLRRSAPVHRPHLSDRLGGTMCPNAVDTGALALLLGRYLLAVNEDQRAGVQ